MVIFKKVADMQSWLMAQGRPVGFVPTMGALHEGHLELVRMSKRDACLTVASIFVNPTQFNDPADLEKYPRMPEQDAVLLDGVECDVLFLPSVEEVYPPGVDLAVQLDFGSLDKVMEGEFASRSFWRNGHGSEAPARYRKAAEAVHGSERLSATQHCARHDPAAFAFSRVGHVSDRARIRRTWP
jgi:pantoate--beta-alanine ligase